MVSRSGAKPNTQLIGLHALAMRGRPSVVGHAGASCVFFDGVHVHLQAAYLHGHQHTSAAHEDVAQLDILHWHRCPRAVGRCSDDRSTGRQAT